MLRIAEAACVGPSSITRPAYITRIRSAIPATTPMSCVISTTDIRVRFRSAPISSRICAWIVTSSAVVGSSAISTFGSHESAIAIITRWRIPCRGSSCWRSRSSAASPLEDVERDARERW